MLVSQAEYARQRGVSRQYVGQMVAKGILKLTGSKVDTDQADAALAAIREPVRPERRGEAPAADLNKAYAHVSETSFQKAAKALCDKLVAMGFEEGEALENIESAQTRLDVDGGLFGLRQKTKPTFTHTVTATPEVVTVIPLCQ